jgi:hypothetical protein
MSTPAPSTTTARLSRPRRLNLRAWGASSFGPFVFRCMAISPFVAAQESHDGTLDIKGGRGRHPRKPKKKPRVPGSAGLNNWSPVAAECSYSSRRIVWADQTRLRRLSPQSYPSGLCLQVPLNCQKRKRRPKAALSLRLTGRAVLRLHPRVLVAIGRRRYRQLVTSSAGSPACMLLAR